LFSVGAEKGTKENGDREKSGNGLVRTPHCAVEKVKIEEMEKQENCERASCGGSGKEKRKRRGRKKKKRERNWVREPFLSLFSFFVPPRLTREKFSE